jgi:uncharacterized protein (DUF111 family)
LILPVIVATHIQLDALGGIAGDMFVASVLDAWPELLDDTIAAIRAAGENLNIVGISLADHRDDVFAGQRFANFENSESELEQHRTLEDIESILRYFANRLWTANQQSGLSLYFGYLQMPNRKYMASPRKKSTFMR